MTLTPIDANLPAAFGAMATSVLPDTAMMSEAPHVDAIANAAHDPADLFTGLVHAFNDGYKAFSAAQSAENDVVAGHGDIQTMIFERARAYSMLQIASGAASHLTQSLNTILQMQV